MGKVALKSQSPITLFWKGFMHFKQSSSERKKHTLCIKSFYCILSCWISKVQRKSDQRETMNYRAWNFKNSKYALTIRITCKGSIICYFAEEFQMMLTQDIWWSRDSERERLLQLHRGRSEVITVLPLCVFVHLFICAQVSLSACYYTSCVGVYKR